VRHAETVSPQTAPVRHSGARSTFCRNTSSSSFRDSRFPAGKDCPLLARVRMKHPARVWAIQATRKGTDECAPPLQGGFGGRVGGEARNFPVESLEFDGLDGDAGFVSPAIQLSTLPVLTGMIGRPFPVRAFGCFCLSFRQKSSVFVRGAPTNNADKRRVALAYSQNVVRAV